MARHTADIIWERGNALFSDQRYSRVHRWRFDGGAEIHASASPHVVPVPLSDAAAVDPEEAFVAALSACHLLWFLAIAAKRGFVVDRYEDRAEGRMMENDRGKRWIGRVELQPRISYSGRQPSPEEETEMHREAHDECFIANSVRTEVVVST